MNIKQLRRIEALATNLKNKIPPSHKNSFSLYHAAGRIREGIEASIEIEKRRMLMDYLQKQPEDKRDAQTLDKLRSALGAYQRRVEAIQRTESELAEIAVDYEIEEAARDYNSINPGVVVNFIRSTEEVVHEIDADGDVTVFVGGQKVQDAMKILSVKNDTRHLFSDSKAVSNTGRGGKDHNTTNPWKKETFNLTEQGRIFKANPSLAERLKTEAGKK